MTRTWRELGVPWAAYNLIFWSSSRAWCCFAVGLVMTWKVGASGATWGVRLVLRTMPARSASRVEKLCAGVPSPSLVGDNY